MQEAHGVILFGLLMVGLVFILAYVGIKMLVVDLVEIPIWISLSVIVAILGLSVAVSWWKVRANGGRPQEEASEIEAQA